MSYTAKSVILDVADGWGNNYIGVHSVDFWFEGSKITMLPADYTAYSTTVYASCEPVYAFDTSLPKTGTAIGNSFLSGGVNTNQRLQIVFNTPIEFDEIRINNMHWQGTLPSRGFKNVKIHTSTDAITSTVYNEAIANSILVFDGVFDQHVASDVEDEQVLSLISPYTSVLSYFEESYTLEDTYQEKVIKFTVDSTKVDSDLTNVPVALVLSDGINDDFTGSDGDVPSTKRWMQYYDPQDSGSSDSVVSIQDNELDFQITLDITFPVLVSNYKLSGDFDIQVDFSMGTPSVDANWAYALGVGEINTSIFSDAEGAYISRYAPPNGNYRADSPNITAVIGGTADTSGKFRLVRVDSSLSMQYWNGTAWTVFATDSAYGTHDVYVKLWVRTWAANRTIDVNFDNFIVEGTPIGSNFFDASDFFELMAYPVNDYFLGTDGDVPDTVRWTRDANATTYSEINNNKLNTVSSESAGDVVSEHTSNFVVSGDFDIQVDFSLSTFPTPAASSNRHYLKVLSSSFYVSIGRFNYSTTDDYFYEATSDTFNNPITSLGDSTGKFRFVREGSVIKGYKWSGTQWEWDGNTSGYTYTTAGTDDVQIVLGTKQEQGSSVDVNFDSFVVNSADKIIWDEGEPNRKKVKITTLDGTTELYAEIEGSPDFRRNRATYHVNIPVLSSGIDTSYLLTYSPDFADNTTYIGDTDQTVASLLIQSDTTDGSTVFKDVSGNGHPITVNADIHHETDQAKFGASSIQPVRVSSTEGGFLSLDDSDDWHFGSEDFTIDFWIYATNLADSPYLLAQADYVLSNVDYSWSFRTHTTDGLRFTYSTNGTTTVNVVCGTSLTGNTWEHVALVRSGTNLLFFIDGALVHTVSIGTVSFYNSTQSLDIGAYNPVSYGETWGALDGYLDEIRIVKGEAKWTAAFTPESSSYTVPAKLNVWDSNTVGQWLLAEDSGNVLDSTVNASEGIVTGAIQGVEGFLGGKAVYFDGINDNINFGSGSHLSPLTQDWTISCCFKNDNYTTRKGILEFGSTSTHGYYVDILNTGYLRAVIQSGPTDYVYRDSSIQVPKYVPVDLVITWEYSSQTLLIYIDGVDVTTGGGSSGTVGSVSSGDFVIGYSSESTNYFDGGISEVLLSNILRPTSQIKAEYYSRLDSLLSLSEHLTGPIPWLSDWANRYKITIDNSNIDADLTHFPVTIVLGEDVGVTELDTSAIFTVLGANSKKIAITKDDAETQIYGEIERWELKADRLRKPTDVRNLGSSDNASGGLSVYGSPVDNSTYYTFNGTNTGLYNSSDLGDSSDEVCFARVRIHNKGKGVAQVIWKDGGYINGVAVGIDASGNLGIFALSSSSATSIVIASTEYENDVWYDIYFTQTAVTILNTSTLELVAEQTGTINPGNGSSVESIGYAPDQSPITATNSANIEWFEGDIDTVEVHKSGDLVLPSPKAVIRVSKNDLVISKDDPTILYVYFDATKDDNTGYIGDVGDTPAKSVWDSNFAAVYHLSQDPSGGANCLLDSTSNAIHATPNGSMLVDDLVDGLNGRSLIFDGVDDQLETASADDALNITDNLTVECFYRPGTLGVLTDAIYFLDRQSSPTLSADTWVFYINTSSRFQLGTQGGNIQSPVITFTDKYYYFAGTYAATGLTGDLFIDGVSQSLYVDNYDAMAGATNSLLMASVSPYYMNGSMGEVRVSNVVRPDAWIKATQYFENDSILSFGDLEAYSGGDIFQQVSSLYSEPYSIYDVEALGAIVRVIEENYSIAVEVSSLKEEVYSIASFISNLIHEPYGLKMVKSFVQWYGDASFPKATINEFYDNAALPKRRFKEPYGNVLAPLRVLTIPLEGANTPSNTIKLPYSDKPSALKTIKFPYSDKPSVSKSFEIKYSEAPVVKRTIQERYKDSPIAKSVVFTPYSNALEIVKKYDFGYDYTAPAMSTLSLPFSISGNTVSKEFVSVYDLTPLNKVTKKFDCLYYLISEVTILDTIEVSMSVNGIDINIDSINISAGLDKYTLLCSVDVSTAADYVNCPLLGDAECEAGEREL